MRKKVLQLSMLVCFISLFLLSACSEPSSMGDIEEGTVLRVVDGDTIKVKLNGVEETVRLLCIDTPEMKDKRFDGPQPFAEEATEFVTDMLSGKKVELELGLGNGRDKYGRLLAYVYVDGQMINERLLEEGLARVAYVYSPNTKYVDQFREIQRQSQKEGKGIWSLENYAQEDGFHTQNVKEAVVSSKVQKKEVTASAQVQSSSDCTIKGNINSKGEKIYHLPGGAYYDRTKEEMMFCTESEAEQAGFRRSSR
ncbi:thermonuclease family protein [Caldalkalibacillus mannanilyticus]|uniref:thermonuclease family protein n=1 Tax=Caldalkalibacillus mannanilyticus TaxID=1418 RepID=UPI000469D2A0|nr:thermonuclease family protein [Caldalkalibacillus mannanilyticus]